MSRATAGLRAFSRFRSFQEALDMAPEDEEFQVRGPLLCLYLDRAMTEATWQQIQLDWGKKMRYFVQWAGNVWICMNQWRCEQLTLEDLQGVDKELVNCATISSTCLTFIFELTWIAEKTSFQQPWIPVDLFYPPATSASTDPRFHKKWGSWSHFYEEAGSLLKGPLFEAPMKGGRWCHLEGLGAHMHIDSF